jgi:hypothetical protein
MNYERQEARDRRHMTKQSATHGGGQAILRAGAHRRGPCTGEGDDGRTRRLSARRWDPTCSIARAAT